MTDLSYDNCDCGGDVETCGKCGDENKCAHCGLCEGDCYSIEGYRIGVSDWFKNDQDTLLIGREEGKVYTPLQSSYMALKDAYEALKDAHGALKDVQDESFKCIAQLQEQVNLLRKSSWVAQKH